MASASASSAHALGLGLGLGDPLGRILLGLGDATLGGDARGLDLLGLTLGSLFLRRGGGAGGLGCLGGHPLGLDLGGAHALLGDALGLGDLGGSLATLDLGLASDLLGLGVGPLDVGPGIVALALELGLRPRRDERRPRRRDARPGRWRRSSFSSAARSASLSRTAMASRSAAVSWASFSASA